MTSSLRLILALVALCFAYGVSAQGYPVRDFAPISLVASMPNVLLVHPTVPAKTLKELVQLAKASPGKLNFGSGGAGTSNHLASELLKGMAKIDIVECLNAEHTKVMTAPASRDRIIGAGFDTMTSTPEQFAQFIKAETVRWGKVIRDSGARAE